MPDRSPPTVPLRNYVLFIVLSLAVVFGWAMLSSYLRPPRPQGLPPEAAKAPPEGGEKAEKQPPKEKPAQPEAKPATKPAAKPAEPKPSAKPGPGEKPKPAPALVAQPKISPQWVTLGSADPDDPYRMLVTLTNRGAALARIELSSRRYHDLEDRSGYLGHLVMEEDHVVTPGCVIQVVGAGTPAAKAGLAAGDRILAVNGHEIVGEAGLAGILASTKPGQTVGLSVARKDQKLSLEATLTRRPLEVVRPEVRTPRPFLSGPRDFDAVHPEDNVPLSMLATLDQIDQEKIATDEDAANIELERELPGLDLRSAAWKIDKADQEHAVFSYAIPERGLEISKTYRLARLSDGAEGAAATAEAYHLEFEITLRNTGEKTREVAYRLDGPNSLPKEGAWYASKVSRSGAGLRDVVYQPDHAGILQVNCVDLADNSSRPLVFQQPPRMLGVDAQYFAGMLMPDDEVAPLVDQAMALRVGDVNPQWKTITNTSFRLQTKVFKVEPGKDKAVTHHYVLFAGPKEPDLLAHYDLGGLIYYGWFGWVAEPMTQVLHFFYFVVRNYGLAIIMLTVLVRLCMFPLSRKQAMNAQKMQELQPEIKKIQEKYKRDMEARTKAQQELFRKHNYNPLGGCLLLFIQLPIFIGLYRSLQVDVELRDASLLSHVIRWCSNLAAPDMLFNWSGFMPGFVTEGVGLLGLGPYFNLLPILTIVLFIWQQKMFMPPPADDQAAMQQKVMNFMMVFMGILFYKVAAGLCIYFIASSLWGLAERKFLPKALAAKRADGEGDSGKPGFLSSWLGKNAADGVAPRKKKNRRKR